MDSEAPASSVLDGGGKDVAPAERSEFQVPTLPLSRKEQSQNGAHQSVTTSSAQPPNSDDGGNSEASTESSEFKVPSLIPSRPKSQSESVAKGKNEDPDTVKESAKSSSEEPTLALPYNEPTWSSTPSHSYILTVIKNGTIIQTIQLSSKPFHVFGRLPSCDVQFEHPSVSRYHAILQYRPLDREDSGSNSAHGEFVVSSSVSVNPKEEGFYVYDLGSTHGTFINKVKIQMRCFYRLRLGQMVKFGGSSRLFLLEVNEFLSPISSQAWGWWGVS